MTDTAAVDRARAEVLRRHEVTTDDEQLVSACSCGAKAPTVDIRRHIEAEAEEAARAARGEIDRPAPTRAAVREPEDSGQVVTRNIAPQVVEENIVEADDEPPVNGRVDHSVGLVEPAAGLDGPPRRRGRRTT